ncbi:hypothetical protein L6452_06275 [Arctium lappa]|uniref:Uncharacterized protein n=1 Tax=Arctium lappa TaxID=4217 RepID=A0ACB9EIF0_ARCLA|nr:hypothetical protein L6452_06275 [Arctium lappa]
MAEEENWLCQTSDDEKAHFTQVCMMAKVEDCEQPTSDNSDGDSEVSEQSDNHDIVHSLLAQIQSMESEFNVIKSKPSLERQSMMNFRDENALLKVVIEDKEKEKDDLKKEKVDMTSKITELEKDLVNLNFEKSEFKIKFEVCFQERNEAYYIRDTFVKAETIVSDTPRKDHESIAFEFPNGVKVEESPHVTNSDEKSEFVENMSEENFEEMMNSSDPVPILNKLESDSVPSVFEKGETSGVKKINSLSKKSTNKDSFGFSDLNGEVKGEWRRKV